LESTQPIIDFWVLVHAINRKIKPSHKSLKSQNDNLGTRRSEPLEADAEPKKIGNEAGDHL